MKGRIAEGCSHYDQAVALYDPLSIVRWMTRFGQDVGVANLAFRSVAVLAAAIRQAVKTTTNEAVRKCAPDWPRWSLILALVYTSFIGLLSAALQDRKCVRLDEFVHWRRGKVPCFGGLGRIGVAYFLSRSARGTEAAPMLVRSRAWRSTGAKMVVPFWLRTCRERTRRRRPV